tara:strand:+ start:1152 stop:1424 length:273 start_codon:yes stop_codon:yes gene_type:complete
MEDKLNKIIFLIEKLISIEENKIKGTNKVNPVVSTKDYYSFEELDNLIKTKISQINLSDKQKDFVKNIYEFGTKHNRVTSKQYQALINLL